MNDIHILLQLQKNAAGHNDILVTQIEYRLRENFENELRTGIKFDSNDFLSRFDHAKKNAMDEVSG